MIKLILCTRFWISEPLAESYEMEVLEALHIATGAKSLAQYRQEFKEQGLELEHLEVQRDLKIFDHCDELKTWIRTQVPSENLVEDYLAVMREKGWIDLGEGKIAFPIRRILAELSDEH